MFNPHAVITVSIRKLGLVQKPVNANLGLKFNQGSCFSYSKEFSQQIKSDRLKATKVKL